MWILDVVVDDDGGSGTTYFLVAGEWSIGRKRCHVSFHADPSISRTHALIRVGALTPEQLGDPSTRPLLELVDKNSRFGSFVNQDQIFGTCSLQNGDHISFGAKKTVLRVRYQEFVLVASRIQRANRAHFNGTCQRIGMHLVATERKDATHCVMDPGRIIATVKVLWALVFNQPVVCTPWIYAIADRHNLSDDLPRCEDYLPSDPSIPLVESNYLPNPLRKTLFHDYAVMFLTPQSMEELIVAMGGIVVTAYKSYEDDDSLIRKLKVLSLSKCLLLVEPSHGTGFSGTAGQSEQQAAAALDPSCSEEIIDRRVTLLKSMGAIFTSIQDLAASVIFVKPPTPPNDLSFSSNLAAYIESSIKTISSPQHLSLRSATSLAEHKKENFMQANDEDDVDVVDVTIKKSSMQQTDPDYDYAEGKDTNTNIMQISTMEKKQGEFLSAYQKIKREMPLLTPMEKTSSSWKSSRVLQSRLVKASEEDACKPVVVSCSLITKRREPARYGERKKDGLVNYKRFKKGNGCSARSSTASLFPQKTVVSVVDNAASRALQENMEAMEAQERIAEELFAMGEGRTTTKLF